MSETWAPDDRRQLATIARNITTRYFALAVEMILGFVMLPFIELAALQRPRRWRRDNPHPDCSRDFPDRAGSRYRPQFRDVAPA